LRIVDVEHGDGGSAGGGSPDKDESHPFEVALPALPAGIEEANDFAGERISAGRRVHGGATHPTQRVGFQGSIDAAILLGQNMLQMETGCRNSGIRNVAVFTTAAGPFADELAGYRFIQLPSTP